MSKKLESTVSIGGRYNSKTGGKIPTVSLPPRVTCDPTAPCRGTCYACKGRQTWPSVLNSYKRNLRIYNDDPRSYWEQLTASFQRGISRPRFVRFHTAGDFPDEAYLDSFLRMAKACPDTKFLAFTKRHAWILKRKRRILALENVSIVLSAWPGMEMPSKRRRKGFSVAWMQDGTETRAPADALECPGLCETCGACWGLAKRGIDVTFHKH